MKSFIRHVLRAAIFLGILLVMLIVMSFVVMPKSNSKEDGMFDERANAILGEPENSIDVMFVGDSEVYSSIIPIKIWERYGYTSYSCTTAGQTMAYSTEFILNAFERQSPKIVVFETNAIYRKFNFDDDMMTRAGMLIPFFKYHDRWKTLTLNDFDIFSDIQYNYIDDNKGYRIRYKSLPADTEDYMKKSSEVMTIPNKNKSYIKKIKSICDDNNAQLILLSTPSTKNWNYKKHNGIDALAKELDVEYIDMNTKTKEIPIDWNKDTYDNGDHLNYYGAEKVTSYLADYLKDRNMFESHKDDKELANSWDGSLEKFNNVLRKRKITSTLFPIDPQEPNEDTSGKEEETNSEELSGEPGIDEAIEEFLDEEEK